MATFVNEMSRKKINREYGKMGIRSVVRDGMRFMSQKAMATAKYDLAICFSAAKRRGETHPEFT